MTTTSQSTRVDAGRLRTVVEDAWRAQLDRITDLSLQLHEPVDVEAGADVESRIVLERGLTAARQSLADLEAALTRLDDGSYGRCTGCGRDIPFERLEALPAAERCVRCPDVVP